MFKFASTLFVFLGGFAVMVLEIIGAQYLPKYFGGAFYVWVSQIGVILVALAAGYAVGGRMADKFKRAGVLAIPLILAGIYIFFIPKYDPLLDAIVRRHPLTDAAGHPLDIPPIWVKLDPCIGSGLVFFLPCFVLATISPYTVRVASQSIENIGTLSGTIYSASTVGSIAGVFVTAYIFIDYFSFPTIFKLTGLLTLGLAGLTLYMDAILRRNQPSKPSN